MKFDSRIYDISIECENEKFELALSLCQLKEEKLEFKKLNFLSKTEEDSFNNLAYERKKRNFILGRYAAKKAINAIVKKEILTEIEIKNGVFGQPLIRCKDVGNLSISISHCDNIGTAIVFPDLLSVGIDFEKVNSVHEKLLQGILSESEKRVLETTQMNRMAFLTMLWAVKEALSKCLRTGLSLPLELYETDNVTIDNNQCCGSFCSFIQYQFWAIEKDDYVLAIVYPAKSKLNWLKDFVTK